jgi:hypothetical protein
MFLCWRLPVNRPTTSSLSASLRHFFAFCGANAIASGCPLGRHTRSRASVILACRAGHLLSIPEVLQTAHQEQDDQHDDNDADDANSTVAVAISIAAESAAEAAEKEDHEKDEEE